MASAFHGQRRSFHFERKTVPFSCARACDALHAIETYHHHDNVETCFKADKRD